MSEKDQGRSSGTASSTSKDLGDGVIIESRERRSFNDLLVAIAAGELTPAEIQTALTEMPPPEGALPREVARDQLVAALREARVTSPARMADSWLRQHSRRSVALQLSPGEQRLMERAASGVEAADDVLAAAVFARRFEQEAAWVQDERRWYLCSLTARPGIWSPENREGALARAAAVVTFLQDPTAKAARDALTLAKPMLARRPEEFNADPHLLATPGDVINLRTGEVRATVPADLITMSTSVVPDFEMPTPAWDRHLRVVTRAEGESLTVDADGFPDCEGDPELIAYLQALAGLAAVGDQLQPSVVFLYGPDGGNGKGVLAEAIREALGDYADVLDPTLLHAQADAHTTGVKDLRHRRFVVADEVEGRVNTSRLKRVTGGGTLKGRAMRQDNVTFRATHSLWMTSNFPPDLGTNDDAIWRRVVVIETGPSIPVRLRRNQVVDLIRAELPGVLAWVIRGAERVLNEGLPEMPDRVFEVTDEAREGSDTLTQFLEGRYGSGRVTLQQVRIDFDMWLKENEGSRAEAPSTRRLGSMLRRKNMEVFKSNSAVWVERR